MHITTGCHPRACGDPVNTEVRVTLRQPRVLRSPRQAGDDSLRAAALQKRLRPRPSFETRRWRAALRTTAECDAGCKMPGAARARRYSTPASCGVNSYTDEQNSQVTSTLPSFTMPARSCGAKLFSILATASREQEHF